jgi:beta-fructofuranosidase
LGLNFQLGKQSGDMGRNWEVCNFFSLQDQQFLIMNVEGVGKDYKERYAMWANVELNGPKLTPIKSGMVDYGCLYAATTFLHVPSQRRLLWGWITEDDLAESRYDQQGWSGCMSLPREMLTLTYKGVYKSVAADEDLKHTFQMEEEEENKSLKLQTLGSRPAEETLALRQGADYFVVQQPAPGLLPIQSKSFELEVDISVDGNQAEIGLLICHNESRSRFTKIVYTGEAVHIIRSHSSKDPDVKTKDLVAPLKLLPFANGSLEKVHMRLFLDNSVLELFVNDRVAFATRIYCDQQDCDSVTLINAKPSEAHFDKVQGWVGLQP